jgi:hypothetical protein
MRYVLNQRWFLSTWLVGMLVCASLTAAMPAAQRRQIEELDKAVTRASRLFADKKYGESGTVVRGILAKLDELASSGDKEVLVEVAKVHKRLQKAHALLELEGIPLPELKRLPAEAYERPAIRAPTGKETVSFTVDLVPVLDEHCAKCHGRERRAGAQLKLDTFSGLWAGGDNGPPIQPGKSADSLLVQKLRGKAEGEAMPLQQPALPDAVIAKFEKWIDEGAAFDGADPEQGFGQLAEIRQAQKKSHQELAHDRLQRALKNWAAGTAGGAHDRAETPWNFLLLGPLGSDTLREQGKTAEWLTAKIGDVFGATSVQPLVKGRITLYCFPQHADYAAFVKKLEGRDAPAASDGHWRFTVLDAYATLVVPPDAKSTAEALLIQRIAAVYIASLGQVPGWFAEGSARVAVARLRAADARVADWDQRLPEILKSLQRPDDFATGRLPEEAADIASYAFVKFLMKDAKKYLGLLEAVRQGKDFPSTFSATYGGSLVQVAKDWLNAAGK